MITPKQKQQAVAPYIIPHEEGTMVDYFGALVTIKADGEMTNGSFSLVEYWAREGNAPPWHLHVNDDELFYILEGEVDIYHRDGDGTEHQRTLEAGGTAYAPSGRPHAFKVASDEAKFLVFTFKPGFEQWFLSLGAETDTYELPPATVPSEEKVAAMRDLAATYGVELLGPPPA